MSFSEGYANLKRKLQQLVNHGAQDGTREAAQAHLDILLEQEKIDELLANPSFQVVLGSIKSEFRERLADLVEDDPKLSAYREILSKMIGSDKAEEHIRSEISSYVDFK